MIGWWSGPQNYVELRMEEKGDRWVLLQRFGKGSTVKSGVVLPIHPDVSYRAKLLFDGTQLHVYVANTRILSQKVLGNPFGTVGFMVSATAATFDNLEVRQTN